MIYWKPLIFVVHSLCFVLTTATERAGTDTSDGGTNLRGNPEEHRELHPHAHPDLRQGGENYIIGGRPASVGEYPWYVSFPGNVCGGTLIASNKVLTSATCVETHNPTKVRVGASNANNGQEVDVECYETHHNYFRTDLSLYNDLAVLQLARALPAAVTPVSWNRDTSYPPETNQTVTVMGFGLTANMGALSNTLQVVDLQMVSRYDCQVAYTTENVTGQSVISSGMHLCALGDGSGVCTGDSGGPLLDGISSDSLQIGVTSFTHSDCASVMFPDVFTDLADNTGWIDRQISTDICGTGTGGSTTAADPAPAPAPAPGTSSSGGSGGADTSSGGSDGGSDGGGSDGGDVDTQQTTPAPTFAPGSESSGGKCLFDTVTQMFTSLTNNIGNILGIVDGIATGEEDIQDHIPDYDDSEDKSIDDGH
ncbi:Chymotrypsin-like elastase family member 1 [Seminavis robusta]|uniref:Chymotrypsin-like elastase family member 1 n=1 Tax=Seminavis robusta TaxID=568900 RepID=A0A9N8DC53_9STRA|nr:Chymotrypsin-like elastase family member 1 [Seminavis robusta]|eukprot:Sro53_g031260.1 Chymotrypsin-like elastase family member 1 (423) ;mRNA; r:14229-15602